MPDRAPPQGFGMSKLLGKVLICIGGAVLFGGCAKVNDLQYLVGEPPGHAEDGTEAVDYYLDHATKIDYPNVYQASPEQVTLSHEPRTIMDLNKDEIREMSLEDCIRTALLNSTVIRARSSFNSPGNSILSSPDRTPSIYDPSIQSTGVLFGSRGVEAALAAFDTSFSTQMTWGRNETVQNNPAGNNLPGGSIFVGETGNFSSTLSKNFAYGGSIEVGPLFIGLFRKRQRTLPTASAGRIGDRVHSNCRSNFRVVWWSDRCDTGGADRTDQSGHLAGRF